MPIPIPIPLPFWPNLLDSTDGVGDDDDDDIVEEDEGDDDGRERGLNRQELRRIAKWELLGAMEMHATGEGSRQEGRGRMMSARPYILFSNHMCTPPSVLPPNITVPSLE